MAGQQTRSERSKLRSHHSATWWLGRWPVVLHRWRLGRLLGHQYLIIEHRGRISGHVYETGVMVLRRDDSTGEVIAVAGSRQADWFRNIKAADPVRVLVGSRPYDPRPRFLDPGEIQAALAWSREHRRRNARVQALFFHWPWPASSDQLHALACRLGGVAFQPMAAEQQPDDLGWTAHSTDALHRRG